MRLYVSLCPCNGKTANANHTPKISDKTLKQVRCHLNNNTLVVLKSALRLHVCGHFLKGPLEINRESCQQLLYLWTLNPFLARCDCYEVFVSPALQCAVTH